MELKAPYADPAANILIVEDDPEIRDIVADVMRTAGTAWCL
jgi:DNA-binding response OmpR family regulator